MSKRLKHILAVLLLLVFITPTAVKLLDSSFHHHYYFFLPVKQGDVIHNFHQTCPIPGFTLAFFSVQKQIHVTGKKTFCNQIFIKLPEEPFVPDIKSSTLLRAPPVSS
jgi:hypothetical protein